MTPRLSICFNVVVKQSCHLNKYVTAHTCSSGVGIKLTIHFPLVSILLSFMITPVGRICDMEGQAAAYKIGAHSFHECSAVTWEGVEELFELAVRATLIRVKPPKPRTCVIM